MAYWMTRNQKKIRNELESGDLAGLILKGENLHDWSGVSGRRAIVKRYTP
jgi:hypothetical protein